jgi:hypothetical protein
MAAVLCLMLLLLLIAQRKMPQHPTPGGSGTISVELASLEEPLPPLSLTKAGEGTSRLHEDEQALWETVRPVPPSVASPWPGIGASAAYDNAETLSQETWDAMVEALMLEKASAPSGVAGLRVVIDTSAYRLTVFRDDSIVCTMPVGLGRGMATSPGSFYIANKISHPTWYNRGNPVSADDPANPLGKRWLGLGQAGQATPLGMHPTAEQRSIGQPMSRGCVRLLPADAEALFRLCPLFTPVQILP